MLCKMVLSQDEKVFLIEVYFATKSLKKSREIFAAKFNKTQPSKTSITHLMQHFQIHGSVPRAPYERAKPVLTPVKLVEIREVSTATPCSLLRRVSQQTNVSYGKTRRAAQQLKLKPYKIRVVHELQPGDPKKHKNYCWFLNYWKPISKLDLPFFSDEAWFCLTGYLNSQNNRHWSTVNPHYHMEAPLHTEKLGV